MKNKLIKKIDKAIKGFIFDLDNGVTKRIAQQCFEVKVDKIYNHNTKTLL